MFPSALDAPSDRAVCRKVMERGSRTVVELVRRAHKVDLSANGTFRFRPQSRGRRLPSRLRKLPPPLVPDRFQACDPRGLPDSACRPFSVPRILTLLQARPPGSALKARSSGPAESRSRPRSTAARAASARGGSRMPSCVRQALLVFEDRRSVTIVIDVLKEISYIFDAGPHVIQDRIPLEGSCLVMGARQSSQYMIVITRSIAPLLRPFKFRCRFVHCAAPFLGRKLLAKNVERRGSRR